MFLGMAPRQVSQSRDMQAFWTHTWGTETYAQTDRKLFELLAEVLPVASAQESGGRPGFRLIRPEDDFLSRVVEAVLVEVGHALADRDLL
jgi:hypothetical protein